MAKFLKKYKTGEAFENDKTSLTHDMPKLKRIIGLVNDIKKIKVIRDDDRLIHAVYEFPEDIPEGSNPFCESSDIIKRFIIDGVEIDFETANNMSWSKGVHRVAFYVDDKCGDDTLNFQNNEFLSSIVFGKNCALRKLPRFSSSSLKSVNIRSTRFKSIGESAFSSCYNLTSITIPKSVTSIGYMAFRYCTSLTSINIPESVMSIGMYAFERCSGLTSINIPESVTSIRIGAFRDCSSLTSIALPKSVTSIESTTFQNCTSLTTITIPESVTSIEREAFYGCSGITSITIPASVTSIGIKAFYNCSGELIVNCDIPHASTSTYGAFYESKFTKVTIGKGVTSIGSFAFNYCRDLTSINISESVTSIGSWVFDVCRSLTSMVVDENNTTFDSRNGCNAIIETNSNALIAGCATTIIPESVTSIRSYAFQGTGLTTINIPESVTSIGKDAFYTCFDLTSIHIKDIASWCNIDFYNYGSNPLNDAKNLYLNGELVTKLTIPNTVTTIKDYAFYKYTRLTSINIPNSVASIGERAFQGCNGLTTITLPEGVTSIGDYAFVNCSNLTSINISDSVTSIKSTAFEGTAWYNNQPGGVVYIGKVLYKYKGTMPSNTSIKVTDGTVSISSSAFDGYSSLISINIPASVMSIGSYAFQGCSGLTTITLPEGVISIENYAFKNCTNLTAIILPESMASIGDYAFYGCSSLASITCFAISAPKFYYWTFYKVATGGVLKYPKGSDYSSWMKTSSYYLGYYNWTSQEMEL